MASPTATAGTEALGAALKGGRERAGLTLAEASYQLRSVLPRGLWKTGETIRRYELGQFNADDTVTGLVLLGLARVYRIRFEQLDDLDFSRDFEQIEELIRSRCCPWSLPVSA